MQKLLLILSLGIAGSIPSSAQSKLRVHLTDNSPITVSLDGRYFNKRGTSVTVDDLPPGRHFITVYVFTQHGSAGTSEDIIYEGKVKTSDGAITLFEIDPGTGEADAQEQDISSYSANQQGNEPNQQQGNGNNQNSNNNINNDNRGNDNTNQPVASPTTVSPSLTQTKIDSLKTVVAGKITDIDKLKLLKDGLNNETVSTDQVGTMMGWLNFEASKVDFAKWAYNIAVDQQNYSSLENKFSYKQSQDELDNYINGNNNPK